MGASTNPAGLSLPRLLRRFWRKVLPTLGLVSLEAVADVLFPLFVGFAINGLIAGTHGGVAALGGLALAALAVGSARRFYDTRAYAGIYETTVHELVERESEAGRAVSTVAARVTLLTEFVEFLENSMPSIITSAISLVGILAIVASIDRGVLAGCLGLMALVLAQYTVTGRLNYRLNAGYNDELERQVSALSGDRTRLRRHVEALMRWNVKISDLETLNYAVVFAGVVALLVYAPIAIVQDSPAQYGIAFAAMLYVFQYIEVLAMLPFYLQQLIRLQEISGRLAATVGDSRLPAP